MEDVPVVIAIVDDSASVRHGLDNLLRSMDYATSTFVSAEAYLARLPCALFDCMICDVEMPGMDGLALQAHLAATGASIPVIMMTALRDPDIEARALAAGAVACLRKPFDDTALEAALHQALGRA